MAPLGVLVCFKKTTSAPEDSRRANVWDSPAGTKSSSSPQVSERSEGGRKRPPSFSLVFYGKTMMFPREKTKKKEKGSIFLQKAKVLARTLGWFPRCVCSFVFLGNKVTKMDLLKQTKEKQKKL